MGGQVKQCCVRQGAGTGPSPTSLQTQCRLFISPCFFCHLLSHHGGDEKFEYRWYINNLARCQEWPVACHAKLVVEFCLYLVPEEERK